MTTGVLALTPEIVTPCPSCGASSLFVGSGGHLTCRVIGCKAPGVQVAVERLRAQIASLRGQLATAQEALVAVHDIHARPALAMADVAGRALANLSRAAEDEALAEGRLIGYREPRS